jgi:hypothetical protein
MKMQLSCGCCEDDTGSSLTFWRRTMHCVGIGDVYAVPEHDTGWTSGLLFYSTTTSDPAFPNYYLQIDVETVPPNIEIPIGLGAVRSVWRRFMQPLRFKMGRNDIGNPFEGGDAVEWTLFNGNTPVPSSPFCPPIEGHSKGSTATQLEIGVPFATVGGSESELKYYRLYVDGEAVTPVTAVTGVTSSGFSSASPYGWSFSGVLVDLPDGIDIHGKEIEIDYWIQFELRAEVVADAADPTISQGWAFNGTFRWTSFQYFVAAADSFDYNARSAVGRAYKFTFSEPFLSQESLSTRGNDGFTVSRTGTGVFIARDIGGGYCDLIWSQELVTIKLQNGFGGTAASYMPENSDHYGQLSPWGSADYSFQRPGIFKPHLTTTFVFRALYAGEFAADPWPPSSSVDPTEFGFPNSIIVGRP